MAGLNRLIGISAAAVDDASLNGTKSYQYNSCSVSKATTVHGAVHDDPEHLDGRHRAVLSPFLDR